MQGMTAGFNTDYSSTKSALLQFFDSLRQELLLNESPVHLTNFYPYIVDTALFSGFSGLALWIVPILRKEYVAGVVFKESFLRQSYEVYIPSYAYWMGIVMLVIRPFSEIFRVKIIKLLMGNGMMTLNIRR